MMIMIIFSSSFTIRIQTLFYYISCYLNLFEINKIKQTMHSVVFSYLQCCRYTWDRESTRTDSHFVSRYTFSFTI